jgi:hypothetical protein
MKFCLRTSMKLSVSYSPFSPAITISYEGPILKSSARRNPVKPVGTFCMALENALSNSSALFFLQVILHHHLE